MQSEQGRKKLLKNKETTKQPQKKLEGNGKVMSPSSIQRPKIDDILIND